MLKRTHVIVGLLAMSLIVVTVHWFSNNYYASNASNEPKESWGIVLVEHRPPKFRPGRRILQALKLLEQRSPHLAIELFMTKVSLRWRSLFNAAP